MLKTDKKQYLSSSDLAKILNVSRVEIFRRIKQGEIPAVKVGRNFVIDGQNLPTILGQKLTSANKHSLILAVNKTVAEYGEALRLLGQE